MENYDEDSERRYIREADVKHAKEKHILHSDMPFLLEIMKINKC